MRRLRYLLDWQARFDARRPLLWFCGACYLLIAGPATLAVFHYGSGRPGFPTTGTAYLSALTILHAITSVTCAAYVASRAADERSTGFLPMVQMTDLSAATLTAFRFLGGVVSLAPLWLLRFPLYTWCYHLGQVPITAFFAAEAVLGLVTAVALSVSMACSQVSRSSQKALMLIGSVLIGSQAIFYFPRILMALVRAAIGPLTGSAGVVNEWGLALSQWALVAHLRTPPADLLEWRLMLPAIVIHLVIALAGLFVTWRLSFADVIPDDRPKGAGASRPPRRVTGDALAWQAVHLHLQRGRMQAASMAFDVLLLVVVLATPLALPPVGRGVLALVVAVRAFARTSMGAGVCMFNEIQNQTLSTLALLPREPLEFFRSWRAGGMRASKFEYVQAAVAIPIVAWNMGDAAASFLGFMLAMALGAPVGCLNALCRFEWAVLWLALWMFPLGFAIIGVSSYAGFHTNQATGLALFALLSLGYHQLIVRQIPYYFQKAVERT